MSVMSLGLAAIGSIPSTWQARDIDRILGLCYYKICVLSKHLNNWIVEGRVFVESLILAQDER